MRVPSDDAFHPSTLVGTETPIRVSHKLSVSVQCRDKGATKDRCFVLSRRVVVASVHFSTFSGCNER